MADQRSQYGTREAHPYANIFPLLPDTELKALADDIAVHGLREPIWLHRDGRIIDGRNRYRACELAGVAPQYRTYQGDDAGLLHFVVSLNLHRRHLDVGQRAMIADTLANMRIGDNQHRREGVEISTPSTGDDLFGEASQPEAAAAAISQTQAAEPLLGPLPSLDVTGVDWVILGGESGPGARPLELDWVRDVIGQCRTAGAAPFVKQLGAVWAKANGASDKKGGKPGDWPEDLRVREYPTTA